MASDGPTDAKDSGMVSLSLNFTDAGKIQNVFAAMSDGGNVTMPLQDTFWGATFGMLQDGFGVNWMFNYDKPKQ
jgi:PhnB protein